MAEICAPAAEAGVSALEALAPDGYQLVFSDTPGMLAPAYKLQEVMQSTVSKVEVSTSNIHLCVCDAMVKM